MPNDVPSQSPEVDSDLETLLAEAEGQAVTPCIDHPRPCSHVDSVYNAAGSNDVRKCPTCLWDFCPDCASILDPRYCKLCLSEPNAELRIEPLVDVEGHVIQGGRHLQPLPTATFYQPRWGTLAKTISEMSDSELEEYVKQYIELVRQAEKALDFRRVVLGSAQLESTQRADARQRKLRSDKTKYSVKTVTVDKSGKPITKTASAAALGDMLKMLEALHQLKKNQAVAKAADVAAKAVDAKMKEPKL